MAYQDRYGVTSIRALEQVVARFEGIIDAVVYFVGFVFCWFIAVRFLRFSYLYTRPSSINDYRRSSGAWALVTGASDGIGLAFANVLASRGFNVVVHGRNQAKLDGVKDDLAKAFPKLSFRVLVADASQSQKTEQQMKTILAQLSDLPGPLTVLVNNVGGVPSSIQPSPFAALTNMSTSAIDSITNLNVLFTMRLTRTLIPLLNRNGPSLVLNIGSLAATLAVPYLSVYSGTKSFLMTWSSSVARELQSEGVNIEMLGIPLGEVTNVSQSKSPPSFLVPTATTMADACLNRIGCGRLVVVGYWTHALQQAVFEFVPEPVVTFIGKRIAKDLMGRLKQEQ